MPVQLSQSVKFEIGGRDFEHHEGDNVNGFGVLPRTLALPLSLGDLRFITKKWEAHTEQSDNWAKDLTIT